MRNYNYKANNDYGRYERKKETSPQPVIFNIPIKK